MELLKQRILQDGRCYPGGILKVDSFINHQMDPMLMYKIAEEFIRRFQDRKINKIVTIEASGIAAESPHTLGMWLKDRLREACSWGVYALNKVFRR